MLDMLKTKPYTLKEGVATMGPGTTTSRVTLRYKYEAPEGDSAVVYMMNAMFNNQEFERNITLFKYWKLIGVKIIIQPRVNENQGNDPTGRITIDWNNDLVENILADDGSKEIAPYSTRYQVYRYAPPDALLTAANGKRINYANWIAANDGFQDTLAPGYLKITSTWQFSFVVELIVLWKGNQTHLAVEAIKKIVVPKEKKEDVVKMKEEEKDKKIEEEENKEEEIEEEDEKENKELQIKGKQDKELKQLINKLEKLKVK
jgi:hypothetical protein